METLLNLTPFYLERDALIAEIERLRSVIGAATQRLNESGTGEMGLLDTIHATHAILRSAVEQSQEPKT